MEDWRSFRFTHDDEVAWELGEIYLVGDTVGILFLDIQYNTDGSKKDAEIEEGDEGVLVYHIEKVIVNKRAEQGDTFGVGDKVFWSGVQGSSVVNTWQSGYYWIGIASEPAAADDATLEMDLKGDKATVTEPV